MVFWLSGAGPHEEPRGAHPGPGPRSPFELGFCPELSGPAPSVPPGGAGSPGAGRGSHYHLDPTGVSALVGVWDHPARLGPGGARAARGRTCTDTPGVGRLARRRSGVVATVLSRVTRRDVWESRADRGRTYRAGRRPGAGGENWGAVLGGGAVSAERGADVTD